VESRWRRNVHLFGLWPDPVGLCSPLLGNEFWKLTDLPGPPGFHVAYINHPSDPNLFVGAALLPDGNVSGRFPYGWVVHPD
jgi:hypothetical protein